ncbi:MAG: amidohydrolase [Pseudomonadota bacterium]
MILVNGDIYTVDASLGRAAAFAVESGRFSAVGTNDAILALADTKTQIIDASGHTVVPGFIDSHSHTSGNSPQVAGVDLSYIVDKKEWLRLIAGADKTMPEGEWIIGGYWDHTLSDSIFPTRQMIDSVVADRPVFLSHIDGHYGWANSIALELADISAETKAPPGGEVVLDPETGKPTGILLEGAQGLVRKVIPARTDAQRRNGLAEMQQYANSFGITGLHQMGDLEDYAYIVAHGDPSIRVWYGQWGPRGSKADYSEDTKSYLGRQSATRETVRKSGREGRLGPLLEVGFVKLMNDGVLSAHTAVLLEEYSDREGWKGEYITEPKDLEKQVSAFNAAGIPVAVHSIGDAAVNATLDAYEAALAYEVPYPNRIEHIEIIAPTDVARFRRLGVVASMQPNHGTNSIAYVPVRVGVMREAQAYVWRTMLTFGVPLVFGADYPTSPLNPLVQIADAVLRTSPFGFNAGKPWHPEQSVSFEQALYAYTQAGASITAWKNEIGSISVGKWADFVVLDGSVSTPLDKRFRELSVDYTYFAGNEVYRK